jgi:hypothetical protein
MWTPRVTETRRRLEPVVHDTFIDDLAPSRGHAARTGGAPGQRDPRVDGHAVRSASRMSRTAM